MSEDMDAPELKSLAHNLCGAAGIFGHAALSAAAQALDACYALGTTPEPRLFAELEARLVEVVATG